MTSQFLEGNVFSVAFAERRDIGEEWNFVKWNKHHHQISYHRLYLLTEGSASIKLYDRELELSPGFVYFIPAYSVLESNIDDKMNKYYIHFQSQSRIFSLYRYLSDKYCIPTTPYTEDMFNLVLDNYTESSVSASMRVQGAMNILLSDFLSDISADAPTVSRFDPVLKYIDENYKRNIPLAELSAIMNINTVYFSNFFKETFRVSPKQYILNKRLAESQRLLLESDMSIKEVAFAVGFDNENYFSEFFSAKVGTSASGFRKRRISRTRDSIL